MSSGGRKCESAVRCNNREAKWRKQTWSHRGSRTWKGWEIILSTNSDFPHLFNRLQSKILSHFHIGTPITPVQQSGNPCKKDQPQRNIAIFAQNHLLEKVSCWILCHKNCTRLMQWNTCTTFSPPDILHQFNSGRSTLLMKSSQKIPPSVEAKYAGNTTPLTFDIDINMFQFMIFCNTIFGFDILTFNRSPSHCTVFNKTISQRNVEQVCTRALSPPFNNSYAVKHSRNAHFHIFCLHHFWRLMHCVLTFMISVNTTLIAK